MLLNEDYTKEELESLTTIYDRFHEILEKKAKTPSVFNQIRSQGEKLLEKNREKLQTNIVGRQVIINQNDETAILNAVGISHEDMENAIAESPYFKVFGELKLKAQLCFALPLILLSFEYAKIGKIEQAKYLYFLCYFKPYASRESLFFKYGVNEDQMLYTVENLTGKNDIKQLGTVLNVLIKKSALSFENYFGEAKPKDTVTDKNLHDIYTSGIGSRVNSFLNGVFVEYMKNKGKYLHYDSSTSAFDDDEEGSDFMDADISSDAALRAKIVSKALVSASATPVDTGIVRLVCANNFGISRSDFYPQMITNLVKTTAEDKSGELSKFLTSLISSFLFSTNSKTGKKYTMTDFKTAVWPAVMSKKIYKDKNSSDLNIKFAKAFVEQTLLTYCPDYVTGAATKKRSIKNAYFMYWIWFLQKCARG